MYNMGGGGGVLFLYFSSIILFWIAMPYRNASLKKQYLLFFRVHFTKTKSSFTRQSQTNVLQTRNPSPDQVISNE